MHAVVATASFNRFDNNILGIGGFRRVMHGPSLTTVILEIVLENTETSTEPLQRKSRDIMRGREVQARR